MSISFQIASVILVLSWLLLRRQADAWSCWILLPLDIAPIIGGWFLLLSISHRPILAATSILALASGLILVDVVKRATLREPIVFADRAEFLEVFRHPRLYLPFAGPLTVITGLGTFSLTIAILIWLEPARWYPSTYVMIPLIVASFLLPRRSPFISVACRIYRCCKFTGEPAYDIRRHGILACIILHATVARHERASRRHTVNSLPDLPTAQQSGPVVFLQIESFFDARRLGDPVAATFLPGLERLQREAAYTGRLAVPCWGANTIRTEFVALTGIPIEMLGLDRFNPYERFALTRVRSIAWTMKSAGYRTICLHPFDKTFYGRHRVMPKLGFDEFRGLEVFTHATIAGGFVADAIVAAEVLRIVAEEGPKVFVFAITVGNHGPWDRISADQTVENRPGGVFTAPDCSAFAGYLAGLQASDMMLSKLMDGLPESAMLAVYGDHQPSLPRTFASIDFTDERTDYAVWSADATQACRAGGLEFSDRRAEDLPKLLLQALCLTNGHVNAPSPIGFCL